MKYGKIIFINTQESSGENFGNIQEVNSNLNLLISLQITSNRALGLTKDNDLLEWTLEYNSKTITEDEKKNSFFFLLQKPAFLVNKIKFAKIHINSSLTMGINFNGLIFVWGSNKDGLLGLGYNITEVDTPTELLGNIRELSISENHAVAINLDGEVFSWGSGKYGELCQDKIIYCPFPTKKNQNELNSGGAEELNYSKNANLNSKNNGNWPPKKYKKVFCSDLLTCFIDEDGKFSYYGVIIKIFKGSASAITIKSLLKDENNSDPNVLFQEKIIYELESENFTQIAIGNGFIGLLSEKGLVYSIDHSDNITLLFTKYCVYSISVSNNQLFGLCKNSNGNGLNITEITPPSNKNQGNNSTLNNININNLNNNEYGGFANRSNLMNKTEDEDISANFDNTQNNNLIVNNSNQMNYFLCRWIAQYANNYVISDSWNTHLYKINNEERDLENMFLLNSNNKEVLFITQYTNTFRHQNSGNFNTILNQDPNFLENNSNKIAANYKENMNDNNTSVIENKAKTFFREATIIHENRMENLNISGFVRKTSIIDSNYCQNPLVLLGTFDDSYNLKYKRVKNNFQGVRTISLDKSKTLNFVKDSMKNETEEISEKLNNSIRKKRTSIHKLSTMGDPLHITLAHENNNNNNNHNEDGNVINILNKNKLFKISTVSNMSGMDSNVNYLLSPDGLNQKNFNDYNNHLRKSIEGNQLRKSQVSNKLNNNYTPYHYEDKEENYNEASNNEKENSKERQINFPGNFSNISNDKYTSSPNKNSLRRTPQIMNDNNMFFNEDDGNYRTIDSHNNYQNNNVIRSTNKKRSDNSLLTSNPMNFNLNNLDSNGNEISFPNPYRNKTNQHKKSEIFNYMNHTKNSYFSSSNYNNPNRYLYSLPSNSNINKNDENSNNNIFRNQSNSNKKNGLNSDDLVNSITHNKNINKDANNKNPDEGNCSNISIFNKSQNLYKNQKLNLSPNQNERENEDNIMNLKINNRNSAEIPGNFFTYKRNKKDEQNDKKSFSNMILNNKNKSDKDLVSEKNDLNESIPLNKDKIKEDVDIEAKIKNYNKNVNYNIFKEEKNLVLETYKSRKSKMHERNNSINYFNSSVRHDETLNIDNHTLDNTNTLHRKYSLEKRIREFKKKISNDLNQNTNFANLKPVDNKSDSEKEVVKLRAVNNDHLDHDDEHNSSADVAEKFGKKFSDETLFDENKSNFNEKNHMKQQNIDVVESDNINIMSTNRTLNSQQMSKNNLIKSFGNNTINLNSKVMNNLVNSKSINTNFNTFSPREANASKANMEDLNQNLSTFNFVNYNYNTIKFSEDYSTGFEILYKVLTENSDIFSADNTIRIKHYFSYLISKLAVNKKFIRRKSRTMSNKSNKSAKSIVSDRYEHSNKDKVQLEFYTNKKDNFYKENEENISSFNNNSETKQFKLNNLKIENKNKDSIFNFSIDKLSNNSLSKESNEHLYDEGKHDSNHRVNNKNKLRSFLKYPSRQIKENSSDEEQEYNENSSEDEVVDYGKKKIYQIRKQTIAYSKETLYLAKIIVKNCSLFYKRNKIIYISTLLYNLRENARWNKILSVIHKNVLTKQFFIMDNYFSRLKKINNIYKGMSKLNKIVYKYMRYLFDTFGHQTRVIYIVKKNLNELTKILNEVNIRKKKFLLLKRLWDISQFKQKLPFYEIFITKLCKVFKRNNRRQTFSCLKKFYYSLKIYTRNMQFLVSTIDSVFLDVKRDFMKKFKIVNKINENLKTIVLKKHLKRLLCIKKAFRKFLENSLNSDEGIYQRIKLKKVFTIYSYKLKFQSVKYLYRWKNHARYLSKFIKNSEKPFKYNLSNDLRALVKKPSKIPGFNNFALNNSFNSLSETSRIIQSPSRSQSKIYKFIQFIKNFINKETFYRIVSKYLGFSRFNQLNFDKRNNINRYRKRNSLDIIEENPSSSYLNNISQLHNYLNPNAKENFSRRSLENSVESNKNKTQITFVCNNDAQSDDKPFDLQYYLMQGNKSAMGNLNPIESPNRKNINLPLSTDNHYFTAGKSMKSSTPSVKNTKYVTPKFTIKDYENNSSCKKLRVVGKINSPNSKNKNLNNIENSSFSRAASMTNLNSNNINNNNAKNNTNLPFNVYLPVQSPKDTNSGNANNVISKDDSIRLNSFNLSAGNSNNNVNNNTSNSGIGSAGNNNNNGKNFVNTQSKNYFKEIVDSFKEKTLIFKSSLDAFSFSNNEEKNGLISPHNNLNGIKNNQIHNNHNYNLSSANNFYNSDGKINSTINYIDGNNVNILLNSFSGKINFENNSENLNYLKYRRNKNNSINFKENNLMKSIVSNPSAHSKDKKSKSHSIHNFPVTSECSDSRLNYEYNFPLNQKNLNNKPKENRKKSIRVDLSNEVIKEELSSPTNNTERNNTNPNRILVYTSFNNDLNNSKGNNPLLDSKTNNLTSKIFTSSEGNCNINLKSFENFNVNTFKNEQEFINSNFSPRSVYSSKENDTNIFSNKNNNATNSINVIYNNNSNKSVNETVFNKNTKNILYSKDPYNPSKLQNERNITCFSNCTGFTSNRKKDKNINNYSELKSLHYQNNLSYLIKVLDNRLLNNQAFAFNRIIAFSQDQIRINKRYSVKMIYRILKKRMVFLKLKFFTRIKSICETAKEYEMKINKHYYSSRYDEKKNILLRNETYNFKNNNFPQEHIVHNNKKSLIDSNNMFDIEQELNEIRSVKNQTGLLFFKNNK